MHLVIEMGDLMWLLGGLAVLYYLFQMFASACVKHPEAVLPTAAMFYTAINNLANAQNVGDLGAVQRWNPNAYNNKDNESNEIPLRDFVAQQALHNPPAGQIFCGSLEIPRKSADVKTEGLFDEKEKDDDNSDDVKVGVEA